MTIFDKARENASAIAQLGFHALQERAGCGLPIHYMDPSVGDGIIRHFPNGTRQRLLRVEGEYIVVELIEPGVAVEPR